MKNKKIYKFLFKCIECSSKYSDESLNYLCESECPKCGTWNYKEFSRKDNLPIEKVLIHKESGVLFLKTNVAPDGNINAFCFLTVDIEGEGRFFPNWKDSDFEDLGDL